MFTWTHSDICYLLLDVPCTIVSHTSSMWAEFCSISIAHMYSWTCRQSVDLWIHSQAHIMLTPRCVCDVDSPKTLNWFLFTIFHQLLCSSSFLRVFFCSIKFFHVFFFVHFKSVTVYRHIYFSKTSRVCVCCHCVYCVETYTIRRWNENRRRQIRMWFDSTKHKQYTFMAICVCVVPAR